MSQILSEYSPRPEESVFPAAATWANANAVLWAIGNGLATHTLISSLAGESGAKGLVVSLILAAPTIVGLLRQTTPRLIATWGSRKWFCVAMYLNSAVVLMLLPVFAAPGILPSARWSLAALVTLWCGYQLLEYFATVALWSWLGDLAPDSVRGRFLGRREAWLSAGRLLGMVASGLFTFYWPQWMSRETLWQAYSLCSLLGALAMIVAVVPLLMLPALEEPRAVRQMGLPRSWREMFIAPLWDQRFNRLIAYGCWLGAVNGLLGASQFFYGRNVLHLSLLIMLAMRAEVEMGQTLISSRVGRWVDMVGNKPVMMVSQLLVALAMGFYLFTTPERWWWILGASTLFITYAGLNVGIPNLLLKLAPSDQRNAYVASHYAWAGFAYGLGSLGGGVLFDYAGAQQWVMYLGTWKLDHFAMFFAAGLLLRGAGAVWIALIPEPPPGAATSAK